MLRCAARVRPATSIARPSARPLASASSTGVRAPASFSPRLASDLSFQFPAKGVLVRRAATASSNAWPKNTPKETMPLSAQKAFHLSSISLAVVLPAAVIASPSIVSLPADLLFSLTVPVHAWFGMNSVINDYVPPGTRAAVNTLLLIVALIILAGLLNLSLRGPGVVDTVKQLWRAPGDTVALKNVPGLPGSIPLK